MASLESARLEGEFYDAILRCDRQTVAAFKADPSKGVSFASGNWDFIRKCAKAVASTGNVDVLKGVVDVLIEVYFWI